MRNKSKSMDNWDEDNWDGELYDHISDPMAKWGGKIIDLLNLQGSETILDAGCGSGRVSEILASRLSDGGLLVGLDNSASMLKQARKRLEGFGNRARFVRADLRANLSEQLGIDVFFDAIFSSATFHWILDHDKLFSNLAQLLLPGGKLVAQWGGEGNLADVGKVVTELGQDWPKGVYFAGVEQTKQRLNNAGFTNVQVWSHPEPTSFDNRDKLATYLATIVLRPQVQRLGKTKGFWFAKQVAQRLDEPLLDYVRINAVAVKSEVHLIN